MRTSADAESVIISSNVETLSKCNEKFKTGSHLVAFLFNSSKIYTTDSSCNSVVLQSILLASDFKIDHNDGILVRILMLA